MAGTDDQGRDYWFDIRAFTGEDQAHLPPTAGTRFRAAWKEGDSAKERLSLIRKANVKEMASDWWERSSGPSPRERFAAANQLSFQSQTYDELPGMIFRGGERREVNTHDGPPLVEFGQFSSTGQELVQNFGYVAIRHELGLPRIVLDARANDAETPRGARLYAKKNSHTSLTENFRGSGSSSPMQKIQGKVHPLDLGPGAAARFATYCEPGRDDEARALLLEEHVLFSDVTQVFDVEITADWFFLYGYAIDVTTLPDPERWAWVFSVTSRVLDRIEIWAHAKGRTLIEEPPGFYTEEYIARPARLAKLPTPSPGYQAFWSESLWG